MAYTELSNPSKYKAHYNTKIKAMTTTVSYSVTLNQPGNGGTIRVIYNGIAYTESFIALEGQDIEILFDLTPGYTLTNFTLNGDTIRNGFKTTVDEDKIITAATAIEQYVVQLVNDAHTKINAKCNGRDNYVNFNAFYNDSLEVLVSTTATGYIVDSITVNGTQVDNGYTTQITKNTTIRATSTKETLTVTVGSISNATIVVVYNNDRYTNGDKFNVSYGDTINVQVTPSVGYVVDKITANDNTISSGNYTVTNSATISAVVSKSIHTVHILQPPENAIITVQENGVTHRADFQVEYGTTILVLVEITGGPDFYVEKILANSTEIRNNSYLEVTMDTTIQATIRQVVHIPEYSIRLNQSRYATIVATNGSTRYTQSFLAQEGSNIDIECNTTVEDYTEITAFSVDSTNYTITDPNRITTSLTNITNSHVISCSSTLIDIIMTLSIINGKIKSVMINDVSQPTSNLSYTIHYQDKISIEIDPYDGYTLDTYTDINGMIRNDNVFTFDSYSSGINNFSIAFTCKEIVKDVTLTITQPIGGTISAIVEGKEYTSEVFVPYETDFIVRLKPNDGYSLENVVIDGTTYTDSIPDTALTMKNDDKEITATFTLMRTVTLDQTKHATLSIQGYTPEADGTYKIPDGETITVTAIPENGYEVIGINKIPNN